MGFRGIWGRGVHDRVPEGVRNRVNRGLGLVQLHVIHERREDQDAHGERHAEQREALERRAEREQQHLEARRVLRELRAHEP